MRRSRCLPLAAWPPADRAAWEQALAPGDVFDAGGPAAIWRPATRRRVAADYGHWLGFLADRDDLDPTAPLAERLTRPRLAAYDADLAATTTGATRQFRLEGLRCAVRVLAPGADRALLGRLIARVRATARSSGRDPSQLPAVRDLWRLGLTLLEEADRNHAACPIRWAVRCRDGLLIALLAARPLRVANLAMIRLDRHVRRLPAGGIEIAFSGTETKNHRPLEIDLTVELLPAVDRYLEVHRPVLLGDRQSPFLWITQDGAPMRQHAIRTRIALWTEQRLGVRLTPHQFRTCAATSLAVDDPAHVRAAMPLLGHSCLATSERYYNKAESLTASRRHAETVLTLRRRSDTIPTD
jgi:integrase